MNEGNSNNNFDLALNKEFQNKYLQNDNLNNFSVYDLPNNQPIKRNTIIYSSNLQEQNCLINNDKGNIKTF